MSSSKDSRFDKVFTDPRFMVASKKSSKVKIDSRFEKMFKDKQFNVVAKVDKYGRKLNAKDTHALQNYYKGDDDDDDKSKSGSDTSSNGEDRRSKSVKNIKQKGLVVAESDSEEAGKKFYDEAGKFHWSGESSDSSGSDDDGNAKDGIKDKVSKKKHAKKQNANSDEEDCSFDEGVDSASYSDDVSGVWSLKSDDEDGQQKTTTEAVGRRIAVKQLDWDSISAKDILSLFRSFCQGSISKVEKVVIYPSKFGKERMERDTLYGPPKEMFQLKGKKMGRKASKRERLSEYLSDDDFKLDENDNGENMAQLRKYEVQKMDYFYAVVYCKNSKVAARIIEENQDMEFELTNLRLNLYIVPDDLEFPYAPKEMADEVPANYDFDSSRISRALNHSTVKLSWDQTDPKRASKLQQNYQNLLKKKDHEIDLSAEEEAYKDLIAGSSSDGENDSLSEDDGGNASDDSQKKSKSQRRIEEMRQKLLGGLTEDKPGRSKNRKRDIDDFPEGSEDVVSDEEEDKEELQVNFGIGFGEDIGKKLIERKTEKREKEKLSEFGKWQEKRKERRREKKQAAKEKTKQDKKQGKLSEKELMALTAEEKRQRAELDLLIDDDEGKVDLDEVVGKRDLRFLRETDNEFAVDPTHKEYKKVTQGHNKIGKRRRQ